MTDPTIASWSRENDLLFQLRRLREENERMLREYITQRPWVGLTGLEQKALIAMTSRDAVFETEAKLKEKNHG